MRIPLNKVYRAFPELDQFSDEQCEVFVKRVLSVRIQTILVRVGCGSRSAESSQISSGKCST